MPLAEIKVIEGVFSAAEKRELIDRVTDAIVSVEGEGLREKTTVIIEEIKSEDWSTGGELLTAESVKGSREAEPADAGLTGMI
jgi:4-oxalocrotonate tautomerase